MVSHFVRGVSGLLVLAVGADEWESLQETLYWLAQPGIRESIAEADADIASGRTYGEDEIRAEFGVPRRPH